MKGMKGKFLTKLKTIKPIGYLKQERILHILHVNAADGFSTSCPKIPNHKPRQQQPQFMSKEPDQENVKESSITAQEPDNIIDALDLMRGLKEEEKDDNDEMELDDDTDDKENISPAMTVKEVSMRPDSGDLKQVPLADIDISSFIKPDLNSGTLFDPNLLAAFQQAVKEHMRMSEAEKRARIEQEVILKKSGFEEEEEDNNLDMSENEPSCKARLVEKEEENAYNPLLGFVEKSPPGGDGSVILYTTTLRGIKKTFEDCSSIKFLLESFRVVYYERDVSMHMAYKEEMWSVMGVKAVPPRLFIKGRYIGGAEEVLTLHEQGKLRVLFEGIPRDRCNGSCDTCGGVRFVLCFHCNGSHKIVGNDGRSSKCHDCNENGIIICPICC
ncbi:Glutaredoxin domain-containing protein [Cephalotus follicularis]|uniref:Glutaredoxin domain-containing protein n=1 Tax=Cephalotus follicularis TaxID=3775 RepID=A0A1Q3AVJ8_CEPFO|nr:Glutaredoxin domain-containing protein [Cephalotus follicularis]